MRVFDGHNDVLALLHEAEDGNESFLEGGGDGQLTLPFAREGGMVGGLFAMFPCSPFRGVEDKHSVDYMGRVDQPEALIWSGVCQVGVWGWLSAEAVVWLAGGRSRGGHERWVSVSSSESG